MSTDNPIIRLANVAGHTIRSVISHDEPERHRMRALEDLDAALPNADDLSKVGARLGGAVTTPDFHPGKPVPVGVVADLEGAVCPHLIGNDIGCGMRMIVVEGLTEDDLRDYRLEQNLRHVFFQGGRDIALTGRDRHAILREGVPGLLASLGTNRKGLLAKLDIGGAWRDADRMADAGMFACSDIDADFADYGTIDDAHRRDAILGTIGGGNHFVELGVVDRIEDGAFATAAGMRRGSVVLVAHSGSLDFGQRVGTANRDRMRAEHDRIGDVRVVSKERNPGLYRRYLDGHANAANIAFANRFLIGLAAVEALSRTVGRELNHRLVYDAPHNTVWEDGDTVRHRKGACPARGPEDVAGTPYQWLGEPVILPGSMGDGTWLLKGLGSREGLQSAAHGAGRRLSRQQARAANDHASALRVVGPVDPADPRVRGRADILAEVPRTAEGGGSGSLSPHRVGSRSHGGSRTGRQGREG